MEKEKSDMNNYLIKKVFYFWLKIKLNFDFYIEKNLSKKRILTKINQYKNNYFFIRNLKKKYKISNLLEKNKIFHTKILFGL